MLRRGAVDDTLDGEVPISLLTNVDVTGWAGRVESDSGKTYSTTEGDDEGVGTVD